MQNDNQKATNKKISSGPNIATAASIGALAGVAGSVASQGMEIIHEKIEHANRLEELEKQEQIAQQQPPAQGGGNSQTTSGNQNNVNQETPISNNPNGESGNGQNTNNEVGGNTGGGGITGGEVEDPNVIAQAIVSGEEIDPNDIDAATVLSFQQVERVQTEDGSMVTVAHMSSNVMVMIDADNDGIFDVITDMDGNAIADVPGTILVADAEGGNVPMFNVSEVGTVYNEYGEEMMAAVVNAQDMLMVDTNGDGTFDYMTDRIGGLAIAVPQGFSNLHVSDADIIINPTGYIAQTDPTPIIDPLQEDIILT